MASAPSACSSSFLTNLFAGNAIVCSQTFQASEAASEQSDIQSVVDNAQAAYGADSTTADVAETAATQQEAQISSDVANVTNAVAASTAGQFFTTCPSGDSGLALGGLPCISFKWLGVGLVGLLLLYFLAIFSSVIPRPAR